MYMTHPGISSSPFCAGLAGSVRSMVKSGSVRCAVIAYARVPSNRTLMSDSGLGSTSLVLPSAVTSLDDFTVNVCTLGDSPDQPGWLITRRTPADSSICQRLWIKPSRVTVAPSFRAPLGSDTSRAWMVERP